jgi:hypothetical protein
VAERPFRAGRDAKNCWKVALIGNPQNAGNAASENIDFEPTHPQFFIPEVTALPRVDNKSPLSM